MKKIYLILFSIIIFSTVSGQINLQDSTVQTIGYWNLHDKQTYLVTENSYQITNAADTTKRQLYTYNVDIEIIDSTTNSFTIQWLYKNFLIKETWNPVMEKLLSISNNLPVIIKTNEYGMLEEVANWEQVRDYITKSGDLLKAEYKDIPNFDKVVDQAISMFSTKEAIESSAIEEIQQFYAFHGVKYKLNEEISGKIKLPNNFGGEPFDADLTAELNSINSADNNYVIQLWQTADPKQITNAAFDYVIQMQKTMGAPSLKKEDFPIAMNETRTTSCIDGPSGWLIYSIQTKDVSINNVFQENERTIELQ